jgi:hypothetical protein
MSCKFLIHQMMDVGAPAATRGDWELLSRESVC